MKKLLNLPHTTYGGTCYINGLSWKGAEYEHFLLPIIGKMAGFVYLKFKMATPTFP